MVAKDLDKPGIDLQQMRNEFLWAVRDGRLSVNCHKMGAYIDFFGDTTAFISYLREISIMRSDDNVQYYYEKETMSAFRLLPFIVMTIDGEVKLYPHSIRRDEFLFNWSCQLFDSLGIPVWLLKSRFLFN